MKQSEEGTEQEQEGTRALDRRRLLRFGGTAALVGAAVAVALPSAASAADGLHVTSVGLGDAIMGDATNPAGGSGVVGASSGGAGVVGITRGNGPGVRGYVDRGSHGSAVHAWTAEPHNLAPTIDLLQAGTGDGLYSHIENALNTSRAVFGRTVGTGIAVVASVANERSSATASKGTTVGSGPGVEGQSAHGVGGKFSGKTAQVQLVPSSASAHPATGVAGQLFVDKGSRLWFCKGGTDWRQLA